MSLSLRVLTYNDLHAAKSHVKVPSRFSRPLRSFLLTLYLHVGLNPGADDVGLGSKLAPQSLVGLLPGNLLLEHLVSEGHEVLHLQIS